MDRSPLVLALLEGRAFSVWSRTEYVEYLDGVREVYSVLDAISYFDGKVFERKHSTMPARLLKAA